jgi:lipid-binding SYLF domain-containing protein
MKRQFCAVALAAVFVAAAARAQESPDTDAAKHGIAEATAVFSAIAGSSERTIPRAVLEKAEAIAVFPYTAPRPGRRGQGPNTRRLAAALGIRARGVLSVRGEKGGWSAPAFVTLVGGTAPAADIVLVAVSRQGVDDLLSTRFPLASPRVQTATLGAPAVSADIGAESALLVYTRPRGSAPVPTLAASAVQPDQDLTHHFYGKTLTSAQAVAVTEPASPAAAWRAALEKHARP